MIIGELVSADGGTRHKGSRKCRLLPESDRIEIIAYIEKKIGDPKGWFCYYDIFKDIPKDFEGTPLIKIYDECKRKYPDKPEKEVISIVKKNLGIYFRDCLDSSTLTYEEEFLTSVKQYRRTK